ncbi:hypothetical protein Q9L58_001027 [Maublancomyces gigas]|uniref:Uncharacterized protein n=1 Tax=Discina gigas TaxID=1032678 RepID=A0ABR3GVF9_9PEZI
MARAPQIGYRATRKYRNYRTRRAKKMIYRLEHQSCKQEVARDIEGIRNPDSTPQPPTGLQGTFSRLSCRASRSSKRSKSQVAAKQIPPPLKSAQETSISPASPFRQTSTAPQLRRLPRSPALLFFQTGKHQVTINKLRLRALAARYRVVTHVFSPRKRRLRFDQQWRPSRATAGSDLRPAVLERSFTTYEDSEIPERSLSGDFPETRTPVRWDFMG